MAFLKDKFLGFFKALYLNNLFFYILGGIIALFIVSFFFPVLLMISKLVLAVFALLFLIDVVSLFSVRKGIELKRTLPEKFSNGDKNKIELVLKNNYTASVYLSIIDELPFQYQKRDFSIEDHIEAKSTKNINYYLYPKERGEYHFGNTLVYVKTNMGLATRRYTLSEKSMVKTYPGFLKLKQFDLKTINSKTLEYGTKKIRRIGQSYEFEQIKEYVQGDNIKDINWKASAKKNQLMINQYIDEKSQQVYAIIDRGRVMKMPFEGLSLLDYAINATLVISHVVLYKQDKAGIFSFSKNIKDHVVAERRNNQMSLILESLYNVDTDFFESDYGKLYSAVKHTIKQRSLLLLFTNFDSLDAVERQMNYLRALNRSHLLIVVFFENTELNNMTKQKSKNKQQVYDKVIAEKFAYEKRLMVSELNKYGIQSVLTTPEKLSIDTINKYIEIKARGMI